GIDAVHNDTLPESAGEGAVVAEFEFVNCCRGERRLQSEHAILRPRPDLQYASTDALRLGIAAQIAEKARVHGVFVVHPEIQPNADRVFVDDVVGLKLLNVETRIGRSPPHYER